MVGTRPAPENDARSMNVALPRTITSLKTLPRNLTRGSWWRVNWHKATPWTVLIGGAVAFAMAWLLSEDFRAEVTEITDVMTSGDQSRIRDYLRGFGVFGPIASILLMMGQVVIAPIPAAIMQLANGVVYGQFWGGILNLIGQMAGAMLAFTIARALGKGTVEKLAGKVHQNGFETWLQRWGGKALFVIRAIPGMPSDFMSYAAGLTRMPVRTYVLSTFLGYIPQSFAYAWLGDDAMEYFWWIVAGGFGLSAIIALASWGVRWWSHPDRKSQAQA
jgi:uncharacterized membrane protein YdjX (TVP38/TMEM64 family)